MTKSKKDQRTKVKGNKEIDQTTKRDKVSFKLSYIIGIGLIIGVTLISYSNTFHVPFLFDDQANILNNPNIHIKVLSWDRLFRLIRNTYRESIRIFSYFTFAINHYFGEFNVIGYHLVNLIIHTFSGILLFYFLILTFNLPILKQKYSEISFKLSLLTSLIFVSHPIQTQSVTYIVQRMTSMAGMFYLITMILYVKGRLSSDSRRWIYFCTGGLTYLLGIFSKENVAILPFFVLLYEFYFFQKLTFASKERRIFLIITFVVSLIAIMGVAFWGKRYYEVIIEGYKIRDFTLGERVLTQFRVVLYYITLLVYPHPSRLNLDYDFPVSKNLLEPPTTLISITIIGMLISFGILIAKNRPLVSYSILWYFGNLVIESSIFPLEMVFEHRLYLPSIGPFIIFSLLLISTAKKIKKIKLTLAHRLPKDESLGKIEKGYSDKEIYRESSIGKFLEILIYSLIILTLSCWTYSRNKIWNSDVELWKDCVQKSPNKPRPHENLGVAYERIGEYKKALESIEKAIQINPKYANAYYNYGLILHKMGDTERGISMIKKSLELDPGLTLAYYSLGGIYFDKGLYNESAEALTKFLNFYPYYPEVHHRLAIIYASQRKFDKAVEEFEWELRINPYHTLAHVNLGQIYWFEFQEKEKALKHLRAALALDPFLPNRRGIQNLVRQLERSP